MRRVLISAAVTAALVLGSGSAAWAAPPDKSWNVRDDRTITWTSPELVPMGDAAVEFWDGDRLLGRPTTKDHRTFTLTAEDARKVKDLQVRAGGRRLDAPLPKLARRAAPAVAPALTKPATVDPGVKGPYSTTTARISTGA